jgi:hypothetical protein
MVTGPFALMKTGVTALALCLGLVVAGGVAVAQQSTPETTPDPASSPAPVSQEFPVSVHQGACPQPEAEPVGDPVNAQVFGSAAEGAEPVGTSEFPPALSAEIALDSPLDEVTSVPHVIAIHNSPEQFGMVIACGDIAGSVVEGVLIVPIRPVNQGTVAGTATVQEEEGSLTITVYVVPEVMAANQ